MATAKDFATDNSNNFILASGDFTIVESDEQHIVDIVNSAKGSWKEYPLCGVGIDNYLNSGVNQQALSNEIKTQLVRDGFGNVQIDFSDNNSLNFTVDAVRG
jgi:phage terminase large subunit-like protein